jgi:hypothetical protein
MNSRFTALIILCTAIAFGFYFSLKLAGGESTQNAPYAGLSGKPIAINGGEIGKMLRKWFSEGTAAGNIGDFYDNRDGGHSNLNMNPYPQLQRIEYTEEQIKARQHWGVPGKILPFVVFGNSSTSAPPDQGGSNPRSYYVNPDGLKFLFTQYIRNNLYIYPEHRDHDSGNNGIGGYGDLFPTNTPYLIASQGSSGSDKSFIKAMPYILAAFRPEVKKRLIQTGMLMPTIQMILRITGKQLSTREEYLTGKAHPSVFRGSDLDVRKMVETAHEITLPTIPPIALLKVVKEDIPVNGIDYFEPGQTEILANTPAVIARVFRGSNHVRKMTVSAQNSTDLNKRPLEFHWVVLRGNPERIKIEYLDPMHSTAEITIPYFRRAPIAEGSDLESSRIDVGVFVHNGVYYSPPAFLTFCTLDNEARAYGTDGRPLEIAYDIKSATISIADWKAFFDALSPQAESWPCKFLRRQFKSQEIAALNKVSGDFYDIHAVLLAARQKHEKANAAVRTANNAVKAVETKYVAARKSNETESSEESRYLLVKLAQELDEMRKSHRNAVAATRDTLKAVNAAQKAEREILEKKLPNLNRGASVLVQEILNSRLQDPDLWVTEEQQVELFYKAAGSEARDSYDKIKKTLILYGLGEDSGSMLLRLSPLRKANTPLKERFTLYEKAMVANLNAIVLSRIILPKMVNSVTREHFVDRRITSVKEWRDVYRYAPDGTPMGWRRYQSESINEFNAEGLLVLEKDSQNRCIQARLVRYELEPQRKNSQGRFAESFRRKVRMLPTDMIREYEYEGTNDWRGHIKRRYLAKSPPPKCSRQ